MKRSQIKLGRFYTHANYPKAVYIGALERVDGKMVKGIYLIHDPHWGCKHGFVKHRPDCDSKEFWKKFRLVRK